MEIKIVPNMLPNRKKLPKKVDIDSNVSNRTIEVADVISEFFKKVDVPREIYNQNLGKMVHIFRGRYVMKNGLTVGRFTKDGYKPRPSQDQNVKKEDEIVITYPIMGG
ncbi:hypothetical protein AKJ37_07065 [candidate division MSBL1 archaeon SCGC-AAA259I09]|uniref:Uncharacterized protein n=1 Tax=candidate division MSBL1 archaeon SCGC-AAA259I09 TaxID=1698267 RepID=A0A133ULJ0_9EURY|nr:hypothetical protein AKJ37_07065 [candidate division MSBL1 archaeon SCGC-AAA259I09]